jgi:type IV pilus assembly protein PilC
MVAAGEAGGILDTILRRLSAYMEKAAKLKSQVKGALTYPIVTISIAMVVLAIILVFVIPVFQEMFTTFGGELPLPTQVVVRLSQVVKGKAIYLLGALILIMIALSRLYKTQKGQILIDKFFLNMPVIGLLIRKAAIAKFTRTMGTMLASGVPILDALDIVAKTAGNKVIEGAVYGVRSGVAQGRTMNEPLAESKVFPAMVCQMIAVGESSGSLDAMMEKIADFYDEEVDQAVDNLTSLIEPMLMVFLGVVIGGIVVAMYLPMFKIAGTIT